MRIQRGLAYYFAGVYIRRWNPLLHEIGLSKDFTAALHILSASTDSKSLFLFLRVSSFMYLGFLCVLQSPTSKIKDIIPGTQKSVISLSAQVLTQPRHNSRHSSLIITPGSSAQLNSHFEPDLAIIIPSPTKPSL